MSENPKPYFGIIPRDSVIPFFDDIKKNIESIPKENEVKDFVFNIHGTKTEPTGISSETFSFNKNDYSKYIDQSKDYMEKALSVLSISINANDENSVKVLEALYNQFKPMIDEIPLVKKRAEKVSYHLRIAGNRMFIDIVTIDGKFIKPFLDMNLNFIDFHEFKASFKTDFTPNDFFELTIDKLLEKVLSASCLLQGKTTNGKYIALSVLKALQNVKLTEEKYQKKLEKAISFLNLVLAFVQCKFDFEHSPKEVCNGPLENVIQEFLNGQNPNETLEGFKMMAEQLGQQMIKPTLEGMGLLESAKAANIDEISIAFALPKYQSGIAHVVKIPGLTKLINEKFLA